MEKTKAFGARLWGLIAAAIMACVLAVGMGMSVLPQSAYADEAAVRATANGLFKFNWHVDGDEYSRGSCFLINEDHVLTAYHCTFFSSAELDYYNYSGTDLQDLKDRMTYSITINRDVKVGATWVNGSEEQDWAVFKLDSPINNRTPLAIRDSREVQAAETVFTVGFPANSDLKVIQTYTPDDVTFKSGVINKTEGIYQGVTMEGFIINGYFLQTDSVISGGDSGGPIVDVDGNVIGVSVYGGDNYYLAVASDVITSVLDDLGIKYTPAGPTPEPVTYELYKEQLENGIKDAESMGESSDELDAALADAKEAMKLELVDNTDAAEYDEKQGQIDQAGKALANAVEPIREAKASTEGGTDEGKGGGNESAQSEGFPMWIIAIIAVVVIAVVVIVILMTRKKKAPEAPAAPNPYQQQQLPPTGPQAAPAPAPAPAPAAPAAVAAETTILSGGESDTILLFQAASGGSLTRMSTNEQIPINSAEFTIGRDRSKVNYCIDGNSSISRIHARFVVRDGKVYLIDNKAANGTYVNGVKARPGQEILLKSGDVITLADEKFKYTS